MISSFPSPSERETDLDLLRGLAGEGETLLEAGLGRCAGVGARYGSNLEMLLVVLGAALLSFREVLGRRGVSWLLLSIPWLLSHSGGVSGSITRGEHDGRS